MVRLSTALAQFLLVISFIWGLLTLNAYRHKRFSLSFYNFCVGALSSGLGVLRYGNPLLEDQLMRPDQKVLQLARSMYPSMVAVELLLLYWPDKHPLQYLMQLFICTCTLVATLWIYQTIFYKKEWNYRMLQESFFKGSGFPISLALAVSSLNSNFHGCVASIFLFVNYIFVGSSGYVFEVPVRDLYSYIQCFCNYHVVKALMD